MEAGEEGRPAVAMESLTKPDERRGFVRINDTVSLHYRYLDNAEKEPLLVASQGRNKIGTELREINNQLEPLLMRLQDRSGAMVRALSLLNRKLDHVLAVTHRLEKAESGMKSITTPATLSANGISFYCDDLPPHKNGLIQLTLSLASFGAYLDCIGKVARWEQSTTVSGRHKVAVIFVHQSDEDQEMLIQYVVRRQMELHREQSLMSD